MYNPRVHASMCSDAHDAVVILCAGALLGPMLLSMLSVFYNLHAKLFRDEAPSSERHYTGSHRTTV